MSMTEFYLVVLSLAVLVAYHAWLVWLIRQHPLRTDIGINACVRRIWVLHVMQRPPGDVLAVQSLRNSLMSASFMASTAILLVAGLLGFALSEKNLENFNHILDLLSPTHPHVMLSRLLVLVGLFFFAFFNFILTVRYYNHVGFMLNAASSKEGYALPDGLIIRTLQRGAMHFTLGMRAFLLVMPFALWLLGPVWLFLGSLLLIGVLWKIDFPMHTGLTSNTCFLVTEPLIKLRSER